MEKEKVQKVEKMRENEVQEKKMIKYFKGLYEP